MTTKKQKSRAAKRIGRKKRIALQQVEQFEDTLSSHELNIARLEATPQELRADDHEDAIEREKESIATIESAIKVTLKEADAIEEDDE